MRDYIFPYTLTTLPSTLIDTLAPSSAIVTPSTPVSPQVVSPKASNKRLHSIDADATMVWKKRRRTESEAFEEPCEMLQATVSPISTQTPLAKETESVTVCESDATMWESLKGIGNDDEESGEEEGGGLLSFPSLPKADVIGADLVGSSALESDDKSMDQFLAALLRVEG
jgi:hypothetical protein